MGADGGPQSARGSEGVEPTGDLPDQQHGESDGEARGDILRLPPSGRPQDPLTDLFQSSQGEHAAFFRWLRAEASKFFKAGRVIAFVLLPLVFVGYPVLAFLLAYWRVPSIPDFFASMSPRRLAFFGFVLSSAIGLMIAAGYRLVKTITRTYRDMKQIDMKKTAAHYVDDPPTRARYVDNLLDDGPNSPPSDEANNDTDRQRRDSFLTFVRNVIRAFQNWRGGD